MLHLWSEFIRLFFLSTQKKKSSCRLYRISGENKIDFQLPLIALTECDNHFHCRVKPRIVRISPKFTHFGRVRNEFSASKFKYSQESIRKPTEIDRKFVQFGWDRIFSEIESQNLTYPLCRGFDQLISKVEKKQLRKQQPERVPKISTAADILLVLLTIC